MPRDTIFAEIAAERKRQDELFGGVEHDSTHSATDWISIIIRHLGLAVDDGSPAGVCFMNDHCAGHDPRRYRRQLVRVAAVAVAALETFDRKVSADQLNTPEPSVFLRQADVDAWWQKMADSAGEPILILDKFYSTALNKAEPSTPYFVYESAATTWERANFTCRLVPNEQARS